MRSGMAPRATVRLRNLRTWDLSPISLSDVPGSDCGQKQIMRVQKYCSIIVTLAVSLAAVLFVAGCAEMESNNTKSLLSSAGFRVRTPQTEQQKQIYTALPAY